jgi:hypothetical protein
VVREGRRSLEAGKKRRRCRAEWLLSPRKFSEGEILI